MNDRIAASSEQTTRSPPVSSDNYETIKEIAALAYEAALRAHVAHLEALKSYRASISTLLATGGVGLSVLAKGAIDKSTSDAGLPWLLASLAALLSLIFVVLGVRCLRLKEGLVYRQRIDNMLDLQKESPAQVRFEMAEAVYRAVTSGEQQLRRLLVEGACATGVLVFAIIEWFLVLAS